MKIFSNFSKFSAFLLAFLITAGCAGINDANFAAQDEQVPALEERDFNGDRTGNDAPVNSSDSDEDVRIARPDFD